MASAKILVKIPINSLTRKVSYYKMPIEIRMVEIYK